VTRVVSGGVLLAAACAAFWWLAFPRHEICSLTFPAPPGCNADRVPIAALWSVAAAACYAGVVFLPARARVTAVLGLVIAVVWGFFAVLYA
jgi:hypothetical protein